MLKATAISLRLYMGEYRINNHSFMYTVFGPNPIFNLKIIYFQIPGNGVNNGVSFQTSVD